MSEQQRIEIQGKVLPSGRVEVEEPIWITVDGLKQQHKRLSLDLILEAMGVLKGDKVKVIIEKVKP